MSKGYPRADDNPPPVLPFCTPAEIAATAGNEPCWSAGLLPQHAALLTASAITDEVAAARGYRSVEQKARLTERGFSSTQARVPALLIPIWNVQGEIALYQTRADDPRIVGRQGGQVRDPARDRGWCSTCPRPARRTSGTRGCRCS